MVGDSQHRCGLGRLKRLAVGQPGQGRRREAEEQAGTLFVSAEPDPIWRRRSEAADHPGTERKLSESRTRIERLGERGSEQRVRVGDVEHAVAADREATGWPHGLGTSTYPVGSPVSRLMRITRHGPRRTPK